MEQTKILKLYKNLGETPLECIERFRSENSQYKEMKMTYAGRLDPMAEGLLLVLAGDTKEKNKYLGLNKTYEFEVLLGVNTDTHDILGIISDISEEKPKINIENILNKIKNIKIQKYPAFSSRTVLGKPLFAWARQNKLDDLEIPKKEINIFDIRYLGKREISKDKLRDGIISKINKVGGDFRQNEIINKWQDALSNSKEDNFEILSFIADVSSGTYIRGLAFEMGRLLKTGGIAYSIKRTRVGEFVL